MNFIEVRTYDNYIPANLVLQRLEEEGIRAYLKDEHTVTVNPIWSNAVGGIKLMVFEGQVQRAIHLLEGYEKVFRESASCPNCNSQNIQLISKPSVQNSLMALLTWVFGSYAITSKQVYQCGACGQEFDELPAQD